jgi:hypothetical protein
MPIDLYGGVFKKASNWAFGSPLLNNVLGSSIFVAITIALLMIVLIMIMYPAKSGTSFSVVLKMFVYMLFGSMLIVFLHDGVIKYMNDEKLEAAASSSFMQNTTMEGRQYDPAYGSTYKLINPDQSKAVTGGSLQGLTTQSTGSIQTVQGLTPQSIQTVHGLAATNANQTVAPPTTDFYHVTGGRLYGGKPPQSKPNPFAA